MLKLHYKIKSTILILVDFFYPPFKKLMPAQTFRYAVCGGSNAALNIILFSSFLHFVFEKQLVYLPMSLVLTPYVASFISAFIITFPIGFYLSMFVVFPGSHLRRRVQLFRYFMVVMCNILLNYTFLKVFVEVFHWYPTPAYVIDYALVIAFTYFTQRYFSFRQKPVDHVSQGPEQSPQQDHDHQDQIDTSDFREVLTKKPEMRQPGQ